MFCVSEMAGQGAGHPDFGLYAAKQVQRGRPRAGQIPECSVVEVKSPDEDAWLTAESDQVSRYWDRYRLVLVTNTRDFVLLGEDSSGNPAKLETFTLADSEDEFESGLQRPRVFARKVGAGLGEYPVPCNVPSRHACRTARSRVAACVVREGRTGACRGRRRHIVTRRGQVGAGGRAWSEVRGRPRRGVLQIDAGADALLRSVLGVGAMVAQDAATDRLLQLA